MKKINVVVIPTWYPDGKDKIMGIYHKEFCAALSEDKDINVNMIYIDRQRLNNPLKYLFMKKKVIEKEKNYTVYKYRILDLSKFGLKLFLNNYTKALNKAYLDYIETNEKPDVIHAHVTIPAGYAACEMGLAYNIPVVVTEHSSYFKRFFTDNNKQYGEFVLHNSYFTTVSNYMKKEVLKYTNKCDVIPNLVDTKVFNKTKHKRGKTLNLVTVSALRQGKKIDDIIKAMKILIDDKRICDIHLNVVGDGFYADYYKKACEDLNMNNYVSFLGKKNKMEIAEILSRSDIHVIASDLETFAIPGIEALASGLPVISTKCRGPEEYIDDKCGKLCEIGNPTDMAKAIYDVYKNIDNYDIKYLKKVAERFSKERVVEISKKIYKNLIK